MDSSITDRTIDMLPLFSCKSKNRGCSDFHSTDLSKVIKHLQLIHAKNFSDVPDSNRHSWCCGVCKREGGRTRRKYRSHEAMWDHIRAHHGVWLVDVVETSDWVLV
jgi:hypothetical protein